MNGNTDPLLMLMLHRRRKETEQDGKREGEKLC